MAGEYAPIFASRLFLLLWLVLGLCLACALVLVVECLACYLVLVMLWVDIIIGSKMGVGGGGG